MHSTTQRKVTFFLVILVSILWDSGSTMYISHTELVKNLGETFVVVCRGDGQKVDWYGPKGLLGQNTKPAVNIATYGTRLTFIGTRSEDAGSYKCTTGKEERIFKLTVAEPHTTTDTLKLLNYLENRKFNKSKKHHGHKKPTFYPPTSEAPIQFKDSPEEQEVKEGEDTVIRCEVTDGEVSWDTEDGQNLTLPKFEVIGDGLVIKNATKEDDKIYVCKGLQTRTGNVKDRRIRLHVHYAPEYYNHYEKEIIIYGYIGGVTELNCQITAKPSPTFTWFDNKKKRLNHDGSVLPVRVEKKSFGDYKCRASNKYGQLYKHFTLEEGSKPNPPQSLQMDTANSNSLDLLIIPPEATQEYEEMMEPKWFNVQYRVVQKKEGDEEGPENEWEAQEFNITEENTYSLMDLQPSTDYEVQAATKNLAGLSDFTNSSIFTTLPSGTQALFNPCILLNIFMFNLCILLIGN